MPPIRIDGSHFSPDTCVFLETLAGKSVRYLIVGGEAVILHGHVRLTGDVDFFFSRDQSNVQRLFAALEEFWDGDVPGIDSWEAFVPEGIVVQFGQPPNRIDLLNSIDGVPFEEAWSGRVDAVVQTERGDVPVTFIVIEVLRTNGNYSLIFDVGPGSNIIAADPALDVTAEVLRMLRG